MSTFHTRPVRKARSSDDPVGTAVAGITSLALHEPERGPLPADLPSVVRVSEVPPPTETVNTLVELTEPQVENIVGVTEFGLYELLIDHPDIEFVTDAGHWALVALTDLHLEDFQAVVIEAIGSLNAREAPGARPPAE
jgi:hypothetical protein